MTGHRCTHEYPDGTTGPTFLYVPAYSIVKTIRGLSAIRNREEGGVRIILPDGTKIYRPNSYYDLRPQPEYILDDYDYDQSSRIQIIVKLGCSIAGLSRAIRRTIVAVKELKAAL